MSNSSLRNTQLTFSSETATTTATTTTSSTKPAEINLLHSSISVPPEVEKETDMKDKESENRLPNEDDKENKGEQNLKETRQKHQPSSSSLKQIFNLENVFFNKKPSSRENKVISSSSNSDVDSTGHREIRRILWFSETGKAEYKLVGGKNANLAEMIHKLSSGTNGIQIPNGFCVTSDAYFEFIESTRLKETIEEVLKDIHVSNFRELDRKSRQIREEFARCEFPLFLKAQICEAYSQLEKEYQLKHVEVAVRSSATAEDLPEASFAGQLESFLNVSGREQLLISVKKCMASLFTVRAISYRLSKGFPHFEIGISVGVQKMVHSDSACSGVAFSLDTESGFRNVAIISASYGLGENVVKGQVNPDEFVVFKPTLKQGFRPIIRKTLGEKEMKMVYHDKKIKNIPTTADEKGKFCLMEDEILQLARWITIIEDYYSERNGRQSPMDIEWAKDGIMNQFYIVQARPETVHSRKDPTKIKKFHLKETNPRILAVGNAIGSGIGTGRSHTIKSIQQIQEFKKGEILVTTMTDPGK
jgi:pyruvate,water dikinase